MRRWFARIVTYLAVAGAGGMLLGSLFLLGTNWWVHRLGRRARIYDAVAEIPAREIAIVPGVGDRDGEVHGTLRSRLTAGLSLYRAHKVKALLVSGIGGRPGNEVSSARAWLLAHGVNPAHVIVDPSGFRTLDTMQRASKTFGLTSAIVCTQPQNIDRAMFLARAAGIDAVGFRAELRDKVPNWEVRLETLKAALAFTDTYVLHTVPRVSGPPVGGPATIVASAP